MKLTEYVKSFVELMDVKCASIQNHHLNKNVKFVKKDFTLNHNPDSAENVTKDVKAVLSKNVK